MFSLDYSEVAEALLQAVISRYLGMFSLDMRGLPISERVKSVVISRYLGMFSLDDIQNDGETADI